MLVRLPHSDNENHVSDNFDKLKRVELNKIADSFEIEIRSTHKKRDVQRLIIEYCIEEFDWRHDVLDKYPDLDEKKRMLEEERNFQREKMNF